MILRKLHEIPQIAIQIGEHGHAPVIGILWLANDFYLLP